MCVQVFGCIFRAVCGKVILGLHNKRLIAEVYSSGTLASRVRCGPAGRQGPAGPQRGRRSNCFHGWFSGV